MNDNLLLIRHPPAKSTESMFGYILRLVEKNGYPNWWRVLKLAGMPKGKLGGPELRIELLAGIANSAELDLDSIRYFSSEMEIGERCLLGNPLHASDLRLRAPAICPECLAEKGYIDAYFDLGLMTGCTTHKMVLLCKCPKCTQPLRWSRPKLLVCQCGARLWKPKRASLSPQEIDLLDILRRRVLGLPPATSEYTSGVPTRDLLKMSLSSLVRFSKKLGRSRHTKRKNETSFEENQQLLHHAANILATHFLYFDKGGRAQLHR